MQTCIESELAYQNQRLNKSYATLMAALNKTGQNTLRDSERKWIAFRIPIASPARETGKASSWMHGVAFWTKQSVRPTGWKDACSGNR